MASSYASLLGWVVLGAAPFSACAGALPVTLCGTALGQVAKKQNAAPTSAAFGENDFVLISGPVDPRVAYAVRTSTSQLEVAVEVDRLADTKEAPRVELGAAMEQRVVLNSTKAGSPTGLAANRVRYIFTVPKQQLGGSALPWSQLRMAIRVVWTDPRMPADPSHPGQTIPRLALRFFDKGPGADFQQLSVSTSAWQAFDFVAYGNVISAKKDVLAIDFRQPADGRASIIINDKGGNRIRNLVSGADFSKGDQRVAWDGRDDSGKPVESGDYAWQVITHAGIKPHYQFSYYNPGSPPYGRATPGSNWGGDHSDPVAAATFGSDVYLGWPVAESGNNIIRVNLDGHKEGDYNIPAHVGGGSALMLAADGERLYVASEGKPWYEAFTQNADGTWDCRRPLNILAYARTGESIRYGGSRGEALITQNYLKGSGPIPKWVPSPNNLAGFVLYRGRLYVSLKQEDRVVAIDPKTGKQTGEFSLKKAGLLAVSPSGRLAAFSADEMGWLEPDTGKFVAVGKPGVLMPRGLAISAADEFIVSDNGPDQDIKVFGPDGKLLRQIGLKGGRPNLGVWNADGVYQPFGIALDSRGKLWVTEQDSMPRRVSQWDFSTGRIAKEFFGPCHYGADGGGFDYKDSSRWIGGGVLWNVDFKTQSAQPISTLYRKTSPAQLVDNLHGGLLHFVHKDGRTFVISQTKQVVVFELTKDQILKPLAMVGSLQRVANSKRWTLPLPLAEVPAVKEAILKACAKYKIDATNLFVPSDRDAGRMEIPENVLKDADLSFLWVDRDGNGLISPDEFQFLPATQRWALAYWGNGFLDTALKIPVTTADNSKTVLVDLTPQSYLPSGAPDYQLQAALDRAVTMPALPPDLNAMAVDRQSRLLVNGNPMTAYDSAGKLLWTIPNNWPGVHASQKSPLPTRGVMQGPLFFLGTAPLDAKSDVTILNGNHGRFFVVSTDGILLDELFADIRISREGGAYMIGGEPFGGFFEKSESTGKYYLQSGHTDYRIFEISGLDTIRRSEGSLKVTPEQAAIIASQRTEAGTLTDTAPREAAVVEYTQTKPLAADPEQWPGKWLITWGDSKAAYPYCEVKVLRVRDSERLRIAWRVKDPSPFVNTGKDWMQLFKTGDLVAFEYSTNAHAPANRKKPVAGDRRLFISLFEGMPVAVLYDYVNSDAKAPVSFSSPWRSEKIDKVTQVADARIEVMRPEGRTGYTVTADLPLEALGLPMPGTAAALRGDFGVLYGDTAGTITLLRSYWSNKETGLVNDVPGEAAIQPANWGTLNFSK
ncbi:MAG: FlgD immunoglobulin-like domain containing protein [Candidatus Methylacidiphilales bacterium]